MKTRVSVWGVLLAPVWLFLKACVGIGCFLGDMCAGILRWVANICFFLDILVWITCGFQMFLLVLIPIAFLWAFPYIWAVLFGVIDGLASLISDLWHIPVVDDGKRIYRNNNEKYYDSMPNSNYNMNTNYNTAGTGGRSLLDLPPADNTDDSFMPEGYAEFKEETERWNNYKPDKPQD